MADMNITNEVLAEKIDGLSSRLSDLNATTQTFSATFVSHEVFELRFRELDLAIKQVDAANKSNQLAIEKLQERKIIPTIVTATIASVLASVFTYLLYARLQS